MCARHLEPLGVLVDHRIDDVNEGLIAREEAVPPGEQIALQPALAHMFAEHLDDAARLRKVLVNGQHLFHPFLAGSGDHVLEAIGGRLVRPEDAEVLLLLVGLHHAMQELPQDARRFHILCAAAFDLDGKVAEVGHLQRLPAAGRRWRGRFMPMRRRPLGAISASSARKAPFSSKSSSGL